VRVLTLLRKELEQLRRDPVLLALVAWLYTVEVIICAYALSFDIKDAAIVALDRDRTPASRELVDRFDRSPYFEVVQVGTDARALGEMLDHGEALAVLRIPSGWSRARARGGDAGLQLVVDGSNAPVAATVRGYALGLIGRYEAEGGRTRVWLADAAPIVEARARIWYNGELKSVYFMVISMIALGAMMVAVIHPAASLVREKESGTMEQLLVTPMRPIELVLAKLLVSLLVGVVGLTLGIGLLLWFDVPIRGSLVLFYAVSLVFHVSAIGMGVFVATLSKNLQQALLLAFFGLIPIMFLSGTIVPVESMPGWLQWISLASPLRYYMNSLLGLLLKGNGVDLLWQPAAAMGAIGVVILLASVYRLRAQIA